MKSRGVLVLVTAVAGAVLLTGAPANAHGAGTSPVPASGSQPSGPYCPDRAPYGGIYAFSYIGNNGHHYDVYVGLPLSPVGSGIVDCDS